MTTAPSSDEYSDWLETTDAEELAIQQAIHDARRRLEHARMIEEALQRWRETKSAREAHAAFLEARAVPAPTVSPETKRRNVFKVRT